MNWDQGSPVVGIPESPTVACLYFPGIQTLIVGTSVETKREHCSRQKSLAGYGIATLSEAVREIPRRRIFEMRTVWVWMCGMSAAAWVPGRC